MEATSKVRFSLEEEEHLMELSVLCVKLKSDLRRGLTCKFAKSLLKSHGLNQYSRPKNSTTKSDSFVQRLRGNTSGWSKKDWDRVINFRIDGEYTVIRDGFRCSVRGWNLVRGDVMFIEAGHVVPADARIVTCDQDENLLVDNRIITGNQCERKSNKGTNTDPLFSENILFANTEVLAGKCVVLVLKTGDQTVFGDLTRFAQKVRYTPGHGALSQQYQSDTNISMASSLDSQGSV